MRNFLTVFMLLLSTMLFGQLNPVPPEYAEEFDQIQQEYAGYEEVPGLIRLEPIEQLFIKPTEFSVQAQGNWAVQFLNIDAYRDYIVDNSEAKIAFIIMDTGGRLDHSDLSDYELTQYSRSFTGETPPDGHGHATHVAGCVGGDESTYRLGPASVLFQNGKANFIMLKVLNNSGSGLSSRIINAMDYAIQLAPTLYSQGYRPVVNMSFGMQGNNQQFDDKIAQMEAAGLFVVASAGNSGSTIGSPANGPSAHANAALNTDGSIASFSNRGQQMYSSAPGVRILSTYPGNQYREMSGTSMSGPIFAGCMGVIWSMNPNLSNRQLSHYGRFYLGRQWSDTHGYGFPIYNDTWVDSPTAGLPTTSNGNPDTPNPGYDDKNPPPPDEPSPSPIETCNNGKDDDYDKLVDCEDPDCQPCYRKSEPREVEALLMEPLVIRWKPNVPNQELRTCLVSWKVSYSTISMPEQAFIELTETVRDYTSRSFLVLFADSDDINAAEYAEMFFERLVEQMYNLDIEVTSNIVSDDEGKYLFTVPDPRARRVKKTVSMDVGAMYETRGAYLIFE